MSDVEVKTQIELVELDTLEPYANNPKQHPDSQIEKIQQSIRATGFDVPIVVDGNGTIIKGHGRYEAVTGMDIDRVPVIWREGMTPEDVTAARIADNKTQMETGFDYDTLGNELEQLDDDFGIETETISEQTAFDQTVVEDLTTDETPDADELFGGDDEEENDETETTEEPVSDDTDETDNENDNDNDDSDPEAETPDSVVYTCPDCGHSFEVE